MSEVNVPLLRKAVEWAEAEAAKPPELCEWNQDLWRTTPEQRAEFGLPVSPACGTAYCIAGYVAHISGFKWDDETDEVEGDNRPVFEVAAELLGIRPDGGLNPSHLFYANNSIEDVRRIAEEIAGERL